MQCDAENNGLNFNFALNSLVYDNYGDLKITITKTCGVKLVHMTCETCLGMWSNKFSR